MSDWKNEVRAAAQRHLSSGLSPLLDNAVFLCERLTEGTHTPDFNDLLLHATCLERNGDYRSALNVLEKAGRLAINSSEEARFLKATCLFKSGMFVDAKNCLLYDPQTDRVQTSQDIVKEIERTNAAASIPRQAYGLHLLGLISSQHAELEEEASTFFECAARLDPFLFQAREKVAVHKGRKDAGNAVKQASLPTAPSSEGVFRVLENACYLLASYRCDESLQTLSQLPSDQQSTGFVLSRVGRAHFEKADYPGACTSFERMRMIDPNRTEGLELYSTALWHMKREVDLAYLARDVAERAPRKPQTWCVVGNCFSLEKEHDLAIRFFKRALQLDENFTYAYTLAGHEYIANEDFEQATACYRHALRTDRSHYNAWWGLGTIYARQEKHELAELHFRKAINIHPKSSVLCCFLGTVLDKVGRYEEALEALDQAKHLQPSNPQARFQRAKVLCNLDRWEEALDELEFVLDVVPKEATVHMFLGKVYQRLGDRGKAMVHFVAALDLDPKGAADVRDAINQMDESLVEPPAQRDFDIMDE